MSLSQPKGHYLESIRRRRPIQHVTGVSEAGLTPPPSSDLFSIRVALAALRLQHNSEVFGEAELCKSDTEYIVWNSGP